MDEERLKRYNSEKGAERYDSKFERRWTERVNNWHEKRVFDQLLSNLIGGTLEGPVLDLPSGTGRLYPLIRRYAENVVESDWSLEMLKKNRENLEAYLDQGAGGGSTDGVRTGSSTRREEIVPTGFVRADALNMPYRDDAFELVVSVRLCHHFPEHHERIEHIREMCRVSNRWVLFTYFEYYSLKNMWREFRRMFVDKRPKWTLQTEHVRQAAREHGFVIKRKRPLSPLFSGHRYTVLERRG